MKAIKVQALNNSETGLPGPSAYRWVILIVCFIGFLMKFADEMVWVPLIPIVKETLGYSMTQAGAYMSARAFGVIIAQIPGGILADRYGAKPVMVGSLLLAAICSYSVGVSDSFNTGVFFRFLTGFAVGPFYAAGVKMIVSWFPLKERATAMGFYLIGTSLAITLVNSLVPTLAKLYSWRYGFYSVALGSVIAAALCFFLLKEKEGEKVKGQAPKSTFKLSHLKEIYANRNLLLAVLVGFGALWATWGAAEWTGTYLKKGLKLTNVQAGLFMAYWGAAAMVCKPVIGFISDRMGGRRKPIIFIDLVLFTVLLVVMPFISSVTALYIIIPFFGFVAFGYSAPYNTLVPELAKPHLAASAVAFYMLVQGLAQMIRPLIIGTILDVNASNAFLSAFLIMAAGSTLGAIAILFLKETKKHDAPPEKA